MHKHIALISSIANTLSKLTVYSKETAFCFSIGASASDGFRLALDTLSFHLRNFFGVHKTNDEQCKEYNIRLSNQIISVKLRSRAGDLFTFHRIFGRQIYRPPSEIMTNVRTIVDLGANIGLATLYFSAYFPEAKYVCVEPNPKNLGLLRHNLTCLRERVQIVPAAISDEQGWQRFDDESESYAGRFSPEGTAVMCETMSSLLAKYQIDSVDILKVDIEGAEQRLFRGNCSWMPLVQAVAIEIHHPYSEDYFRAHMQASGLQVLPPSQAHPRLWALRPSASA